MLRLSVSGVLLVLVLQMAASLAHPCLSPTMKCDFVCDCSDCSDEQLCGYKPTEFHCDFEDTNMCGWTDKSLNTAYKWERQQRGNTVASSGPSSDYTTGIATGSYMGVTAVKTTGHNIAALVSPEMQQTAPTCRLRLRYFMWDSADTGLGANPLWASVHRKDSQEAIVWRPEPINVRGWREATIYLGRIEEGFRVYLNSQRSEGQRGDVALDQLEFLDCALPLPVLGKECPAGTMECGREGCVELQQVCDGTDDCGDGTDEANCDEYRLCDFENGTCEWDLRSLSNLTWMRTNQKEISMINHLEGPGRDHSQNSASGHFLYVTVPEGGLIHDWAAFQSPLLQPTNSSHPCKMVMYTHQFGPRSGGLSVLVADRKIYPVWQRGGALGDLWAKAEVEIVTEFDFFILIVAAIRDFEYGGIAIDSITLSPECRKSNANVSWAEFPKPPGHPCTTPDKMCDFQADCLDAADEAKCGDFSHAEGSSGWTDTSTGGQGWVLQKNTTAKEEYLVVVKTKGQQRTEAQIKTPLLGPSGPKCSLSFDFALTGNPAHIGELSARVIDSKLGVQPKLWEFSGKTGKDENEWRHAELAIGARTHRFQLVFEARAIKLCPCAKIKVRNVRFVNCHANYLPASSTDLSCNFERGLCGWYQDNCDNFDWTVQNGADHTIGIGRSLVVDMWSSSLRGTFGRLISYPQLPSTTEQCLSFFYKVYGPNTGGLNVKLKDSQDSETVLWTRSAAHGNMWHKAHCPIPHQLNNYQLIFEAVRSGFDGQVAIDDVALVNHPCSVPRLCSFEGHRCGYTSSTTVHWLHRNGHATTISGPRTDHTLETPQGYYMMVNTGASILPAGSISLLTSPPRHGVARTECINFFYRMGGENAGSLAVYMKPVRGNRVKIFSDSPVMGDVWRHGNGNISSTLVDWQLEFEVTGAGGKDTYVAIDDIFLSAEPCESQGKCSLERGLCGWSNRQSLKNDQLDWELTSQKAEKHYPTPGHDHTLGLRGHFLFLSSSNRTSDYQTAQLLSPHLPPTRGTCLKFWAFQSVPSNSKLNVWRLVDGRINQLMVVSLAEWRRFEVNIESSEEYQIVFEGIKGTSGVLALDDIEYTIGVDCSNMVMDAFETSPKGDDTGGIVASVIVVLLLIGTLAGLLYYYLKTRQMVSSAAAGAARPSDGASFSNDSYVPDITQNHVTIPPSQSPPNHPMAAGFNDVADSSDFSEREV